MKYILFFFIFVGISCGNAHKISWDRMKANNVRHIGTKSIEFKIEKAAYYFTLTVFAGEEKKEYCLLISSIWKLENNGIALLKLGNNDIVRLVADNTRVGKVDWPKYNPIIGGPPYGVVTTQKVDYYTSIFELSNEDLRKIEQYGVCKIRIEYGDSFKEKSWSFDKLGVYIKDAHRTLETQLRKPAIKSQSIEEGF